MLGLRFPKVKIMAGGNPASAAGGPSLTTPLSPMRPLQTPPRVCHSRTRPTSPGDGRFHHSPAH